MAVEYLFDFPWTTNLCLVRDKEYVRLGPGKQWVSEVVARHPYIKMTGLRALEERGSADVPSGAQAASSPPASEPAPDGTGQEPEPAPPAEPEKEAPSRSRRK